MNGHKILITGAAGFIGSHLARRCVAAGAEVHAVIRPGEDTWRIQDIESSLDITELQLDDAGSVQKVVSRTEPSVIYHLAADSNVARDLSLLPEMVRTNITGTMNLALAALSLGSKLLLFVNTGTCEEYGFGSVPFDETQRELPVSPYSFSKVSATYFCAVLNNSFSFPAVTVRPFLTYGPQQDTRMFLPSLIRHCIERKDFPMTRGDQTREFNYIDDIVEAYYLTGQHPETAGQIINFANGIEYPVKEAAEMVLRLFDYPIQLMIDALPLRPGEPPRFYGSGAKAARLLGWKPRVCLQEGLKKTINWYRAQYPRSGGGQT